MRYKIPVPFISLAALFGGVLACRPILAIGTGELIVLVLIILLLLGPLLFRFYRLLIRLQDGDGKDKKRK